MSHFKRSQRKYVKKAYRCEIGANMRRAYAIAAA